MSIQQTFQVFAFSSHHKITSSIILRLRSIEHDIIYNFYIICIIYVYSIIFVCPRLFHELSERPEVELQWNEMLWGFQKRAHLEGHLLESSTCSWSYQGRVAKRASLFSRFVGPAGISVNMLGHKHVSLQLWTHSIIQQNTPDHLWCSNVSIPFVFPQQKMWRKCAQTIAKRSLENQLLGGACDSCFRPA